MSSQPLVVFDCDDVIANIRKSLHQAMAARGYLKPIEKWHTYDFQDNFGLSVEACLEIIVDERILERAEPEVGAREAIDHLHRHGYRTEIWTARGWHPGPASLTQEWADRNGLKVDSVRLFGLMESKSDAMSVNYPVHAFLDDNLRHIVEASGNPNVHRACLMNRPWNVASPYADRTTDLIRFAESVTGVLRPAPHVPRGRRPQ